MNGDPTLAPTSEAGPEPRARQGLRLPLARPVMTYVLLAVIIIFYLLESWFSGSLSDTTGGALVRLGAQVNGLIVYNGEYWRLLAAMFLHIGLMHILFNGWALYSLGREVEALYGTPRFLVIFLLTGLFGNVAFYLYAALTGAALNGLSAGASGAIFGLVGADIAYFFRNRRLFGSLSRQQLGNLLTLVVINLIFGFTVPGINNVAHLGGLISGLLLGLGLAPHYTVRWEGLVPSPRLVNGTPIGLQVAAAVIGGLLLLEGVRLGDQLWAARLSQRLLPSQDGILLPAATALCAFTITSFHTSFRGPNCMRQVNGFDDVHGGT